MAAQGTPAGLGHAHRELLAYIDFRFYLLGELSKSDVYARIASGYTPRWCKG